jgi:hypothetical protein
MATEQSARGSRVKLVTGSKRHSDTTSAQPTTPFSYEHDRRSIGMIASAVKRQTGLNFELGMRDEFVRWIHEPHGF